MSAPNELKISTICAACGKPAAASCSRCRLAHYFDRECQLAQWPAHKGDCRRAGNLRALPAVPADLPEKVAATAALGLTEVFVSGKGRGLMALKPISRGTVFAFIVGQRVGSDADLASFAHFEYLAAKIVGDVGTGTRCLPDAVNGSLVNDS